MPTLPRLRFGAYWLDPAQEQVGQGTRLVRLTPKAFAVLRYLVERPGQLVTKDELFAAVWAGTVVSDAALTKCVRELRQALKDDAKAPQYIETAHRRGVRFLAPVTPTSHPVRRRAARGQRPSPSTPHLLPPTPHLVGREAELAQLHGWCEYALRGARQMIFVTGEAGIGKTTVVDALVHRLVQEKRVWVARGQCIEHYGGGEAYMPVLEALEQLGRGPAGARLVPLLRQHAPTWLVQMPGLLRGPEWERLQRQVQGVGQERRLRELAAALDVLTARQGLVLWLEDLQWSDVSTLDVLAVLGRRQAPARLLVLGTYRPVEVLVHEHPLKSVKQELQVHGQCQELAIDFLSVAAVGVYLARRFPGLEQNAGGLHRLAQFVHQRTDGNALFMVNMVEYLVRQGVLREAEGQWALHGQMGAVAGGVPESLQQMIERHFEQLPPAQQRLLEVASVEGVEFSTTAVAAGLATTADSVEEGCEGLVRLQQFLRASGTEAWPDGTVAGRYRFRHALYHEVVYRRVAAGRRRRLHQEIGVRKEAGYGERAPEMAAELALHFARGRDDERAVRYYRQAGEKALERSAHREAAGYFEQALKVLPQLPETRATREQAIDLWLALRTALQTSGDFGHVLVCLREAEALAAALNDPRRLGQISGMLSNYFYYTGAYDQAIVAAQHALALATAGGDGVQQGLANRYLGVAYMSQGDYRRAIDCLKQTVVSIEGTRRHERFGQTMLPAVQSRAQLAKWHTELGLFTEGSALGDEGLRMAEAVAHPASLMYALQGVGVVALRQGDLPRAIPRLERAMDMCQEADLSVWFLEMAAYLGEVYILDGRIAAAVPLLTQALEQAVSRERVRHQRGCRLALSQAHLLAGRLEEAQALAEQALALARAHQERGSEAYTLRLLGEIATRRDAPDSELAASSYRQALALADERGMRPLQAHCHLGLGILYAITGQREQARAALTAAIALYRTMDMTLWLPQAEAALAQIG